MIEEAIIEGFKGTFLANIRNLHFKFGSPIQIIAGTNGCGKTRLMNELNPLPPDPKDYYPSGRKELLINTRYGKYRLTSKLHRKAFEHSFKQISPEGTETELNPGGTATVQRELVQRIFGLTPMIQAVLSGKLNAARLSGMPYMKRRELFTELCPVDLTYAINVYQQLKTQATHALGARKTAEKRLANITAQLIDQSEIVALQQQSEQFNSELEVLMRNYNQSLDPREIPSVMQSIATTEATLLRDANAALSTPSNFTQDEVPELLEQAINDHQQALTKVESQLQTQTKHYTQVNELAIDIANRNGMSKEQLLARLNELKRSAMTFGNEVVQSRTQECKIALEQLETVKGYLVDCLQSMPNPSATDFDFSVNASTARKNQRELVIQQRVRTQRQLDVLEEELSHVQHTRDVECPKCNSKFKPGVRPERVVELKQQIEKAVISLKVLEETLANQDRDAELQAAFDEGLQRLRKVTTEYPRLGELWSRFAGVPFAQQNTQTLIYEINRFEVFLGDVSRYRELEHEQQKLEEVLEHYNSTDGMTGELIDAQAKWLELEITKLTEQAQELKATIRNLQQRLREVTGLISKGEAVKELLAQRGALYERRIALERNRLIENAIEALQRQLALVTHRLHEVTVNQALAQDLERQIIELKTNEQHYEHLLNALSPTDGLIAEQLSGFIAEFVGKMNELISKFWTYDIRVLPCGIENGDLNYRFPVEIISEENRPADVSEASWGQKDLVDFAFKLVIALYLKRPEWPIYLDELGATFDETHHRKVLQFVKDYISSGKASMVFIVSHYASSHTAMADAELTILDTSNVSVLKDYNKHVTIS